MILVCGGAGYIGSHVCKELSKLGFSPIVFDNLSTGHREFIKWGPFIEGDLLDEKAIDDAINLHKPIAVMHFAAKALVSESVKDPHLYYSNNVVGSINLLKAMRKNGVNKFIFSSTCATYGIPTSVPLTEDHPKNPISAYGTSKLMIEQILADYQKSYNINSVSLRYFNAAGADLELDIGENHAVETHLIPNVIDFALGLKKDLFVYGHDFDTFDGTAIRDYVHVLDIAKAHIKALEYILKSSKSLSINLGSGKGFSVIEIIKFIESISKKDLKYKKAEKRFGDPAKLVASNKFAKDVLGWELYHSDIETIITSAYNWHQKKHNIV